ncbi:MAG: Zn-ribbon domain-containing OB-fold protein [Theionarchaea archaeon]|nr:Zn-ribbon domain-containing OB-fold protein [Theionarchaea archaeon]MBU7036802.1 Zn-ribbon domain-containing OB-fold protein [Theionarchaea archaeon]
MEISRNWRLRNQRYRLVGTECGCGHRSFPPRRICPTCRENPQNPVQFSGTGTVYSYSTLYEAPEGFEQFIPYTVALIDLDEGPMISAQLTDVDPEDVAIGMRVEMVTRKLKEQGESGLIVYGYKFRPIVGCYP